MPAPGYLIKEYSANFCDRQIMNGEVSLNVKYL